MPSLGAHLCHTPPDEIPPALLEAGGAAFPCVLSEGRAGGGQGSLRAERLPALSHSFHGFLGLVAIPEGVGGQGSALWVQDKHVMAVSEFAKRLAWGEDVF